jgi:DNA-binding beta-propeller fold protein YncE
MLYIVAAPYLYRSGDAYLHIFPVIAGVGLEQAIDIGPYPTPGGLAVSEDGKSAYVAVRPNHPGPITDSVLVVDLTAKTVTQTIRLQPGADQVPPVLIPGEKNHLLYALLSDQILVLDLNTGSLSGHICD